MITFHEGMRACGVDMRLAQLKRCLSKISHGGRGGGGGGGDGGGMVYGRKGSVVFRGEISSSRP